jgi:hypothetical protein
MKNKKSYPGILQSSFLTLLEELLVLFLFSGGASK